MVVRILVVLLLITPMLAGLNYMRNEPLDQDLKDRTYATVSDADLDQLLQAYQAQLGHRKEQVDDAPEGMDLIDRYGSSDVGGKAEGFANFQERNDSWRAARGKLLEEQAALDELERERSIRGRGLHTELGRIRRRVTAF